MKFSVAFNVLAFSLIALLTACGGSDDTNSDNSSSAFRRHVVDWSSVPEKFNPEVSDIGLSIESFDTLDIDIFSFNYDIQIVYSNKLPKESGFIRAFSVWNKFSPNWIIDPQAHGSTLRIGASGRHGCEMEVVNEKLETLEGACLVRLQVFLPKGSQLEVYNDGELISKKFLAIKTEQFLKHLDDATWSEDKFVEIKKYLNSYKGKTVKPTLTTNQLAIVLNEFSRGEEKLQSLRQLHKIVVDKENFAELVENEFSYFDQEEARKILRL